MSAIAITQPNATPIAAEEKPLREIATERDKYTRRGDLEMLGRLKFVFCDQGTMDFQRFGPMLGRLTDGQQMHALVFVQPWEGLPAFLRTTDKLCPDCAVDCLFCESDGKHQCRFLGCGGAGVIVTEWLACGECVSLRAKAASTGEVVYCQKCGDPTCGMRATGRYAANSHECPNCKGTKRETCQRCRGTRKMSTGAKDGRQCPSCLGRQKVLQTVPQPWEPYRIGQLEGYTVLGPLRTLVLAGLPEAEPGSITTIACYPDLDGNYPVLLIAEPEAAASRAYVYGGRLEISGQ